MMHDNKENIERNEYLWEKVSTVSAAIQINRDVCFCKQLTRKSDVAALSA